MDLPPDVRTGGIFVFVVVKGNMGLNVGLNTLFYVYNYRCEG